MQADPAALSSGFGKDVINGFVTATDIIQLPKGIAANLAAVQAHESTVAGGTMIAFSPSESIYLPGISQSDLKASNFQFV